MFSSIFSAREYFAKLWKEVSPQSSFSGLANSSAKLALLGSLLEHGNAFSKSRNILFLAHDPAEVAEINGFGGLFFSKDIGLHRLPEKTGRDEAKVEWMIHLAQKSDQRHFFLMSEVEEKQELFPSMADLINSRLVVEKGEKIDILRLSNALIEIGFEVSPDVSLEKGQYRRSGEVIDIFPVGAKFPFKIEMGFGMVEEIWQFDPHNKQVLKNFQKISLFPAAIINAQKTFSELLRKEDLLIADDINEADERLSRCSARHLCFSPFPEDNEKGRHFQMRFLSVLKFYSVFDLLSDIREKLRENYIILIFTKRISELSKIFLEEKIPFATQKESGEINHIRLIDASNAEYMPPSFQNPDQKILFLTDREIFQLRSSRQQKSIETLNLEYLTSLKIGDYVVHLDHGIGRFLGITDHEMDGYTREYLEIAYAKDDRLFVPVDQADKVSRYLCEENSEPKLHRLGSQEWENIQKKAKKETEAVAKELLKLYAEREQARKKKFLDDNQRQREFEQTFPYEETPGQIAAIADVKKDMESDRPMDRLICGDVGFGKTEVAMRAAFKAVESGRQVAVVSPVTILTQQHFESFSKRMSSFGIRISVLSRFKTPAEQKIILADLQKGKIDIVVGTHRLLQKDIVFRDLGLLIVDEEQRFGVKQKEKLKALRKDVDILTLTATPIPRTLNLALNKLRDISTITTPPPGRLPIATEVRKYSDRLVRDAILKELERNGQVYFLHNRVQTIEAMADKLRFLIPEAKVVVGHGQLSPHELEKRILAFKEGKYNVLVSSTIIENGIDLPTANTMIVMNAERFGLSQLYQLRGRIGRGKRQAFAYFLYQTQKLSIEAKKRLRAIVEASELGSGFQIAMRDLEIRGSGDVLGVSQSGTVNAVGVGHFLRMLNETIRKMKEGQNDEVVEEEKETTIELPVEAFIPSFYIADAKEKILAYQNLAAAKTIETLREVIADFSEEYGKIPRPLRTLLKIIELKITARKAHILAIRCMPATKNEHEIELLLGKKVTAANIMNLLQQQESWLFAGDKLKIPRRKLGLNFLEEIQKAVELLGKNEKKKSR